MVHLESFNDSRQNRVRFLCARSYTGGTGGVAPLAAPLQTAADVARSGPLLTFVSYVPG
jgi:hypothetical protein